jgi:hypothetical protein
LLFITKKKNNHIANGKRVKSDHRKIYTEQTALMECCEEIKMKISEKEKGGRSTEN